MNISAKKLVIAVATVLLCIVAALFWPGSNQQKQRDNTIGAAMALSPPEPDTVQAVLESPEPRPAAAIVRAEDGTFTLQVSSWRSRRKAEWDMQRYQAQGFDAYIQRVDIPEKGGVWHRVRLGRFPTAEVAAQQAEALQDMLQAGYWIAAP